MEESKKIEDFINVDGVELALELEMSQILLLLPCFENPASIFFNGPVHKDLFA